MKIHERLKNYAKENGIKQRFISQRSGIDDSTISAIFNGKRRICVEEYQKICLEGLQVNPGYFFSIEGLESKKKNSEKMKNPAS